MKRGTTRREQQGGVLCWKEKTKNLDFIQFFTRHQVLLLSSFSPPSTTTFALDPYEYPHTFPARIRNCEVGKYHSQHGIDTIQRKDSNCAHPMPHGQERSGHDQRQHIRQDAARSESPSPHIGREHFGYHQPCQRTERCAGTSSNQKTV